MQHRTTTAATGAAIPRAGMLATVRNRRGVELLLRRRIQRVLVLTPASLRRQWREELWEKFALRFEVVDRQGTDRLRRRLGMDAAKRRPRPSWAPGSGTSSMAAARRNAARRAETQRTDARSALTNA